MSVVYDLLIDQKCLMLYLKGLYKRKKIIKNYKISFLKGTISVPVSFILTHCQSRVHAGPICASKKEPISLVAYINFYFF